jgi:hypothetical protein
MRHEPAEGCVVSRSNTGRPPSAVARPSSPISPRMSCASVTTSSAPSQDSAACAVLVGSSRCDGPARTRVHRDGGVVGNRHRHGQWPRRLRRRSGGVGGNGRSVAGDRTPLRRGTRSPPLARPGVAVARYGARLRLGSRARKSLRALSLAHRAGFSFRHAGQFTLRGSVSLADTVIRHLPTIWCGRSAGGAPSNRPVSASRCLLVVRKGGRWRPLMRQKTA